MRRSSKVILLLLSPLFAIWLFYLPSFLMARVPKTGRVVDSTTGEGIAGATIIASAMYYACGGLVEARCADNPEYRVVTHTDASGRYWIRPTFGGLWPLFPVVGDRREEWYIAVVEPGYAVVGDHVAWTSLNELGAPTFFPPSASDVPAAYSLVLFAIVEPIRMYRVDLDLEQTALYTSELIVHHSAGVENWNRPEEVALRRGIFAPMQTSVCARADGADFDYGTFSAFARLAPDGTAFFRRAQQIDASIMQDPKAKHRYSAAMICEEMKAGNPS